MVPTGMVSVLPDGNVHGPQEPGAHSATGTPSTRQLLA
jgi:hypothetical protein